MTTIYGLANCDACRAARRARPDATFVDVRAEVLPDEVLAAAVATFGDALVNRRSATWRGLGPEARRRDTAQIVRDHPAVMKRPLIIEADGEMRIGRAAIDG